MGNIKINCNVCDSIRKYQFRLEVFNSKNELLFNKEIDNKKAVFLSINKPGIYTFIATPEYSFVPYKNYMVFNVDDKPIEIEFKFYITRLNSFHSVNIRLTDKNYIGLPIMKGEIILWLNT